MVEGDAKDDEYLQEECISGWVAKALSFLRFDYNFYRPVMKGNVTADRLANKRRVKEYCLIQYYDVFPKHFISVDQIDKTFNCV